MKLSTRTRYGTRILIDLASTQGRLSLGEITRRQDVSRSYLEHLIAPLISAGIVGSSRGFGGGIWLARDSNEIKLSQVIKLLEGSRLLVDCIDNPETCARANRCITREIWRKVEQAILDVLDSITLKDLVTELDENIMYKEYFCPKT